DPQTTHPGPANVRRPATRFGPFLSGGSTPMSRSRPQPVPLDRRTFLAASASALGVGLAARPKAAAAAMAALAPGDARLTKAELPTPALLVDLDRLEANLKTMADHCKNAGCHARPHAKTHKCPEIARRQVAAGARGVSVATVPEAEAMVAAGIKGVLL